MKKNLKITWGVLLIGLKKDWLSPIEVVKLANEHATELSIDENFLVDLNLNDDDRNTLINLLGQKGQAEEDAGIEYWQKSELMTIEQSDTSIEEKLKSIELQWSKFDYPDAWRSFIYYLPNANSSSNEELYRIFLNYLKQIDEEQQ